MIISSLRGFSAAKATVNEVKQQPTEWEKILTNHAIDRELSCRICNEFKKPNNNKIGKVYELALFKN